jgi:polar amino acid transport system permease protein
LLTNLVAYIVVGTAVTLAVTLVALPMGLALGLGFALLKTYGGRIPGRLVSLYSTLMRGVPPVVLLFILFFTISGAINLSAFWAGALSLGIVSSAYQLEILRGALLSVSSSQLMAARAIGMNRLAAIRYIVLPQALRLAIPPWSNEAAIVIKDSSLVYALGVTEILRRAQQLSASTQQPFLAYGTAALIYFLLVFATNRLLDLVERRTRIPSNS